MYISIQIQSVHVDGDVDVDTDMGRDKQLDRDGDTHAGKIDADIFKSLRLRPPTSLTIWPFPKVYA